jgi:uncharacterized protein (TIGR02099 family)
MMRVAAKVARGLAYTFAGLVVFLTLIVGGAWLWFPNLDEYKPEVERLLSGYLGQKISMTTLNARRDGLNFSFEAGGVRVAVEDYPGSGIRFGGILVSVHAWNLLSGRRTFERLELMGPTIEAARLPDGRIRVGDTIIGTPRGVVRRLLQGENLEVTDGTFVWRDALAPEQVLEIEDVDILIRPGEGGREFDFTATAPADLMRGFNGHGSYDPESLNSRLWTASLDLSVKQVDLSRIPAVIQERLPWESQGHVDTDFRAEWSRGKLTAASADLVARDFVIPYARDKTPLAARRFGSSVSWRRSDEEWRLVFSDPEIVIDDQTVSVSRFELEWLDDRRVYSAQDANVQDLLGVVNRLDIEVRGKEIIDRLAPRGVFSRAGLTLTGPYLEATGWRFEGDFRNLGWLAQERFPGVQGLDGHLTADDKGGELSLVSRNLEVDAPDAMRQTMGFTRVEGSVEWYQWGRDWVVDVSDGTVGNDDLNLTDFNLHTRVSLEDKPSLPHLQARFRVPRADIKALRHYLPVRRMKPKQIAWTERALAGGELTQGRFYMNGPLDKFPYKNGGGEIRFSGAIRDGVFNFNEKWPNLRELEGVVELNNSKFEARAHKGMVMNSPIGDVRTWSDDIFRRDRTLYVEGSATAQVNDVVWFLRRGPLIKNPPPEYRKMTGRGEGELSMTIELPFTRLKEASRVNGEYTVENAAVEVADGIEFTKVSGTVNFTESTVNGTGLQGELLGGPVRADVTTVEPGRPMTFALTGSGEVDAARLVPVVGPVLVSRLAGRTPWSGRFVGGPGPSRLEVHSDLKGVKIDLPQPLWKPGDAGTPLDVEVEFEDERRRIVLILHDRLRGELQYDTRNEEPFLTRGVLNLGADRELPASELSVAVKGEHIDMDRWIEEVGELSRLKEDLEQDQPGGDALFEHLRTVDIDVQRFRYLRRNLGPLVIDADSEDGERWTARFDGPGVKGTGLMQLDQTPARYRFDLSRLELPRLENVERASTYEPRTNPSEFVHLSLSASEFRYGDMNLGQLHLHAGPEEHAWRIRKLSLTQPALKVDAEGLWSADRFGAHRTRVEASVEAGHLGEALTQLGLPGQVANGRAEVIAGLNWAGEPGDFRFGALNGELSFNARDGRFLKLEPGSGRLLGLFNIEQVVRRLKLDFTDVFKEGLTFDRIDGKADIAAGRLHTDGIFILGPAALMELNGSTHLGTETYDLDVTVAPQFGANLSLAGAIANPAAGAMIFVVQKLFKKQMAKLINYEYRVTGSWSNPKVDAVEHPVQNNRSDFGRN